MGQQVRRDAEASLQLLRGAVRRRQLVDDGQPGRVPERGVQVRSRSRSTISSRLDYLTQRSLRQHRAERTARSTERPATSRSRCQLGQQLPPSLGRLPTTTFCELLGVAVLDVPLPPGAVGAVRPTSRSSRRSNTPCRRPRSSRGPSRTAGPRRRRTSAAVSVSTPRWLIVPASPAPSNSTSLSGGSVDREVGVAGLRLGRADAEHLRVELDGLVEVGDVEGQLQSHRNTP